MDERHRTVKTAFKVIIDDGYDPIEVDYDHFGSVAQGVDYILKRAYTAFLGDRRKRKITLTIEEGHERKGEADAKVKKKKVDRPRQSTTDPLGSR